MDTRTAKMANSGFKPDPAIAFFDALAANTSETHIMKLPKVPNTKGKYLAQYVDTTGTVKVGCWGPCPEHFVVYRVTPFGVSRFFFEYNTTDFKNTNSRNHYLTGSLGEIYKTILTYRKVLKKDTYKNVSLLMEFKGNLDRLIERKSDTTLLLRQVISVITGKTVEGFQNEARLAPVLKALNGLRCAINDLDYMSDIKYKK